MSRISKERFEEIRRYLSIGGDLRFSLPAMKDLLSEVDALQEEKDGLYADLIGQEHLMGSKIEVIEAENSKLKDRIAHLRVSLEDIKLEVGTSTRAWHLAHDALDADYGILKG